MDLPWSFSLSHFLGLRQEAFRSQLLLGCSVEYFMTFLVSNKYTYIGVGMYVCILIYVYTYICIYVCVKQMRIYIYVYVYAYIDLDVSIVVAEQLRQSAYSPKVRIPVSRHRAGECFISRPVQIDYGLVECG